MNLRKFQEIGLLKYFGYFVSYVIVVADAMQVVDRKQASLLGIICFLIIAWAGLMLVIYNYREEQRNFDNYLAWPLFSNLKLVILLTLLVTVCRIGFDYLQSFQYIYYLSLAKIYLLHESKRNYYFIVLAFGIVLPIMQVYLADGFFFNHFFRASTRQSAIIGMITSGLVFALLNMEFQPFNLLFNLFIGILLAWSFLRSQALWLPMYLALINSLLLMIAVQG